MKEPCSKECEKNMICDFCSRYTGIEYSGGTETCTITNKHMEPYEDCDCDMFRCFTLDKRR